MKGFLIILKGFLIGALKLVGLFITAIVVAVKFPEVGQIIGIVALLAGGIAVIKPLPRIGLGHRGFSFLVAILVGLFGLIISTNQMYLAERRADLERLDELRDSDPDSYLAELRSTDEARWLQELMILHPEAFQAEMDRRAKQAAERAVAAAARAEEERLAEAAEEKRRAQAEEAARAAEAARAEKERLAAAAKAEDERLAEAAEEEAAPVRAELASPPEPVHVQSRRWETHCDPQCRTFTLADFRVFSESPPTKLVLEIDPNRKVLVSALDTEAQHRKFYTNRAPIELRRGSVNYVPARSFFNDRFAAELIIDGGAAARLSTFDESHLGGELTDGLLARLRAGSRAELVFVSLMRGKGQRVTFSLLGFTKSYDARTDSPAARASASADARSIIAASLKGNQFKLKPGGLQERPNPRGEGVFVFFPEMEIAGHKRLFVWFVHGDQAVALNGPSKTATPSLPFPRGVSFRFWTGTGLSVDDATSVGLAVAFK